MSNRTLTPVAKELIAAKARIADKGNWWNGDCIQGPRQNCAITAIPMTSDGAEHPACNALSIAGFVLFGMRVTRVNDTLGHAAVMRMYDHAIRSEISKTSSFKKTKTPSFEKASYRGELR